MSAKELNIGDYVRTKEGYVCKILKLNEPRYDDGYLDFNDINSPRIYKPNVVKSSPNIIDLIEVGDILKFKNMKHYQEVLAIDNEKLYLTGYIYMSGLQEYKKEIEEDLEWVITHEQIEQMAYKIGE